MSEDKEKSGLDKLGFEQPVADKPEFDEHTLAKFLEAAYVLQEHNRRLAEMEMRVRPEQLVEPQAPPPPLPDAPTQSHAAPPQDDYTHTLAQIVETQHQIQVRHLELNHAMALVAERVAEIGRAHGAAIGMIADKKVCYRAESGLMTLPAGTEVAIEKALCVACLRTGQVIRCTDVATEFLLDADECRRRGIQSLIAVPVYHDGGIAGALELYYSSANAFSEQDVHTCQLMAGLVTEALARSEELTSRRSLADERAAVLEALEKIKPNLAALVDASNAPAEAPRSSAAAASSSSSPCAKCGHPLLMEELFCGKCGQPRSSDYGPPDFQSKVASLWHMQEAKNKAAAEGNGDRSVADTATAPTLKGNRTAEELTEPASDFLTEPNTLAEEMEGFQLSGKTAPHELVSSAPHEDILEDWAETPDAETSDKLAAWSSAASAKDFLEQLSNPPSAMERMWKDHRGDIALGLAVILVACVIRWGIWSNHPVSATGSPSVAAHRAPDADLSFWDRTLIKLGLADPPEPPVDNGNPGVQVWIDLQTGLYYCPGTDLYGKTPRGKYASQRDAQLDSFESASRKACN